MRPFKQLYQLIKKVCSFLAYSVFLFLVPKTAPRKADADIAVICLASLGDFITFCTVARDCYRKNKSIILICREKTGIKEFAELTGYFKKIYPVSTKIKDRFGNLKLLSAIHVKQAMVAPAERHILSDLYMLAVSAENRLLPDTFQACTLPTLKRIVDDKVEELVPVTAIYELERYEQYLENANLLDVPLQPYQFDNNVNKTSGNPYIIVFPGAGGGKAKQWPPERFAYSINDICRDTRYTVFICGTKNEFKLGECLRQLIKVPVKNLCGKTELSSLKHLLERASLVLANDSGSAHFAIACNVPTVVICGCWEYGRFYPNPRMPQNSIAVIAKKNSRKCIPCGVSKPKCTASSTAQCVLDIPYEEVIEAIRDLTWGVN